MKKNLVLVTQYFPPEIGGGSQRSIGFAEELRDFGMNVIVLTPFPSYLVDKKNLKTKWRLYEKEIVDGLTIYRTFVFASDRGNFVKRILYYLSFPLAASIVLLKIKNIDYVLTISPPLFTSIVGIIAKKIKSAVFIFDIGDLWPESAIYLGFLKNKLAISLSKKFEKYIYRKSDFINVVTQSTKEKLLKEFPFLHNVFYIPNFVDTIKFKKIENNIALKGRLGIEDSLIIGYAGNIGSAQGLEIVIDAALMTKHIKDIKYLIIGDGIEKELILNKICKYDLNNIIYIPPVSRTEVISYISVFDIAVIPLVKNDLFKITIPSKLYETMAMEIPVLLCVDGEARKILEMYDCGFFVQPENSQMLHEKIMMFYSERSLITEKGRNGRVGAEQFFDRRKVIRTFYENCLLDAQIH